jgi:predicted Zn-dependent protease
MRLMHSLVVAEAVAALFCAAALATPTPPTVQPTDQPVSEKQLVQDSGYTGWRHKWANINQVGDRNLCGGLDFYSLQHQIDMGRQIAQRVMQSSRLIKDSVVTEYINRIGQNIVRNSDARVPFTFRVVDSDEINAFALPGGFVFVNSGLILRAGNEAQLASVMSHEIAHVDACHGAKQASKSDLTQIAMVPLAIMLPYGWAGYGIYEGVNAAIPLAFLKFSREDESQADFLGLEYMYKTGYDPNAFVSFFEKLEAQERRQPGTVSRFFADHPATPDRISAIQKEISTILPPRSEYVVDTSDFEHVKHRLQLDESHTKLRLNQGRPTLKRRTNTTNVNQPADSPSDKPPILKRGNSNDLQSRPS